MVYSVVPVNHKDGNKENNRKENLEWISYSDNNKHAIVTGLMVTPRGVDSTASKLTTEEVNEIRRLYTPFDRVFGARALAIRYGVHHTTISKVAREISYI